jgi:hypothetical protein
LLGAESTARSRTGWPGWCTHPSRPKAAFWGCVLSLLGFIGYGALYGIDYMAWVAGKSDTGLDPTTMQRYIEAVATTNAILVPVLLVFTLLPIGLTQGDQK